MPFGQDAHSCERKMLPSATALGASVPQAERHDIKMAQKTLERPCIFLKIMLAICKTFCYYSIRTFFEERSVFTYESEIFSKAHLRKMQNHQKKRGHHDHL